MKALKSDVDASPTVTVLILTHRNKLVLGQVKNQTT